MFDFQSHNLEPDEWQHICFAVSMNQIKIALNGEILFNDEVVDLITNEIKNTTLWIGGIGKSKVHDADNKIRLQGTMTDVHFWNESLGMDHLTSITKSGSSQLSDLPVIPHLFSWPSLKMESNTSCSEYFIVDRDEIQSDPPEKVLLVEKQKDFDFSNYICQAYGGRLYVPENDNDLQ